MFLGVQCAPLGKREWKSKESNINLDSDLHLLYAFVEVYMYGARLGKATSGPTNRANYLLEGYDYPHTAPQSHYYTPEVETRVVLVFKNINLMNS